MPVVFSFLPEEDALLLSVWEPELPEEAAEPASSCGALADASCSPLLDAAASSVSSSSVISPLSSLSRSSSVRVNCVLSAGAKAEYKALPESQQTQARKISIALARSGRLYAMQASYDKEVENIVSQMRTVLTANGQSTALADQAMASYKAQKSAMYSQLTAKLYS